MDYRQYARQILEGESIDDKLLSSKNITITPILEHYILSESPGRVERLKFDNQQVKFPRSASFHLDEKKALALHFFANHELLAIEMMAAALLVYPDINEDVIRMKKGLVKTIQDEQKHLSMYIARMREFGVELGDFPLNDFFWRSMEKMKTPSHFYAAMAMTFESANLDFAQFYEKAFRAVGDEKTANIMKVVFEDEISHVALGAHWLNHWKGDKKLWEYYSTNLPGVMTPARAKGINYDPAIRLRCGLDNDFIKSLTDFRDDFNVTNRKSW